MQILILLLIEFDFRQNRSQTTANQKSICESHKNLVQTRKKYIYNKLVEEASHWTLKLLAPGPANVFLIRFFFWFCCCQRWFHFNPYNCHFVANELNRKISFDNFLSGKSSRELWLHTKHGMKLMMEEESSSSAAQFRRFLHSQIGLMLRNAKTPKGT